MPKNNNKLNFIGVILIGILIGLILIEAILQSYSFFLRYNPIHERNNETYVILALGESTTANLQPGYSSWPNELEKILNNRSKKYKFIVYNEGQAGSNSGIILRQLDSNLKYYNPDIVITMIGINDAARDYANTKKSFLKIPSVAKWIYYSIKQKNVKKCYDNEEEFNFYVNYYNSKNLTDIEEKLKNNCHAFIFLGNIYYKKNSDRFNETNINKARLYYEKSLEYNKNNHGTYYMLMHIYTSLIKNAKDEAAKKKLIDKYRYYSYVATKDNFEIGNDLDPAKFQYPVLKNNYVGISNKLKSHNITHIAMQYPLQPISYLIKTLNETDAVIVSNEENFESALKNYTYEEIFRDKFGGNFGHATKLGNKIIAENLAANILKNIE